MPEGRISVVAFTAISVTAQQTLIYVKPAADKPCFIHSVNIGVAGGTAGAGDAQEELLRVELIRLPATVSVGSGGSSATPSMMMTSDTAAAYTARVNDTSKATTSGTPLTLGSRTMNSRIPFEFVFLPEDRPFVANAQAIIVNLNTTPADALEMNGEMVVAELG